MTLQEELGSKISKTFDACMVENLSELNQSTDEISNAIHTMLKNQITEALADLENWYLRSKKSEPAELEYQITGYYRNGLDPHFTLIDSSIQDVKARIYFEKKYIPTIFKDIFIKDLEAKLLQKGIKTTTDKDYDNTYYFSVQFSMFETSEQD